MTLPYEHIPVKKTVTRPDRISPASFLELTVNVINMAVCCRGQVSGLFKCHLQTRVCGNGGISHISISPAPCVAATVR